MYSIFCDSKLCYSPSFSSCRISLVLWKLISSRSCSRGDEAIIRAPPSAILVRAPPLFNNIYTITTIHTVFGTKLKQNLRILLSIAARPFVVVVVVCTEQSVLDWRLEMDWCTGLVDLVGLWHLMKFIIMCRVGKEYLFDAAMFVPLFKHFSWDLR